MNHFKGKTILKSISMNKSEVVAHNGFRYRQYLTDVGVDTDVILQEIVQWIRESNCYEYGDLVDYAVSEKF
ncbi:hypothetical protein [Lactococcus cremoris]|uniref:Replication protein n=1 Tax=Lactococcus lactis subsp. cremoris TaxID=1359 RepID=A0ABR5EJF2_LACLC|nr:hypothetical protein [Lactococcus cremoris]KKW74649.1 Replication protein [Lactococcus cremoris]